MNIPITTVTGFLAHHKDEEAWLDPENGQVFLLSVDEIEKLTQYDITKTKKVLLTLGLAERLQPFSRLDLFEEVKKGVLCGEILVHPTAVGAGICFRKREGGGETVDMGFSTSVSKSVIIGQGNMYIPCSKKNGFHKPVQLNRHHKRRETMSQQCMDNFFIAGAILGFISGFIKGMNRR